MRKKREKINDLLVVKSGGTSTTVLNGGYRIGAKDGTEMTTEEFNKKVLPGIRCLYNPKFTT